MFELLALVSQTPRTGAGALAYPKPRSGAGGLASPKPRSGEGGDPADQLAQRVMDVETTIARATLDRVALRDPRRRDNPDDRRRAGDAGAEHRLPAVLPRRRRHEPSEPAEPPEPRVPAR